MSVRFFVTLSALMIFSWLAATYIRAVPLESYPSRPSAQLAPVENVPMAVSTQKEAAVRLISTAN